MTKPTRAKLRKSRNLAKTLTEPNTGQTDRALFTHEIPTCATSLVFERRANFDSSKASKTKKGKRLEKDERVLGGIQAD